MNNITYQNYKTFLEEAAREYRWQCGLEVPPYDPRDIARLLGITVKEVDLQGLQGYVERKGNQWFAYISRRASSSRRRFTLAHEIGHVVLATAASRGGFDGLIRYRTDGTQAALHQDPAEEALCNAFAAEFLLPTSDLRERFCTSCISARTVFDVSRAFHVSLQSAARKIVCMIGERRSACHLWNIQALWPLTRWHFGIDSLTESEVSEFERIVAAALDQRIVMKHVWPTYGRIQRPTTISLLPLAGKPLVLSVAIADVNDIGVWCSHSRQLSLW
jgi:Zn-dependent peptidase ImmA (M78 family)